jgi:hypothetical protein
LLTPSLKDSGPVCELASASSVNRHKQNDTDNVLGQLDYDVLPASLLLSSLFPQKALLETKTGCHNDVDAYLNVKSLYLVRICLETNMAP